MEGEAPGGEPAAEHDAAEAEAAAGEGAPAAPGRHPHRRGPATAASRDFHKPQFMDFANPLLVGLLGKMALGLRSYRVVVEERLPGPGELTRHEGAAYATEMIVQVDFPGSAAGSPVDGARVEEHAALA
jgi:hypothetical protein